MRARSLSRAPAHIRSPRIRGTASTRRFASHFGRGFRASRRADAHVPPSVPKTRGDAFARANPTLRAKPNLYLRYLIWHSGVVMVKEPLLRFRSREFACIIGFRF